MERRPNELVLFPGERDESLWINPVLPDGLRRAHGGVKRDWNSYPRGCYASAQAIDFPLIDMAEWPARLAEKVANKSLTSDIRLRGNAGQPMPSRDQNGKGYCWAHSSTSAALLLRAMQGGAYGDLSAYGIACMIKNFQDQGGWGAQSLDFFMQKGCPTSEFWPQQSMSRSNDNAKTWENAALYKVSEGWVDLAVPQYNRKLSWQQVGTLLLCNVPIVSDFNWWSHSVCSMDLVAANAAEFRDDESGKQLMQYAPREMDEILEAVGVGDVAFGNRIWNSWGDSWSDRGMGVLTGAKARPDGAVAPRAVVPN
jgi:hypothetical protein